VKALLRTLDRETFVLDVSAPPREFPELPGCLVHRGR
jgi:hypothetical protein